MDRAQKVLDQVHYDRPGPVLNNRSGPNHRDRSEDGSGPVIQQTRSKELDPCQQDEAE